LKPVLVLPGTEPGKIAGMARRHEDSWFIGVMNGKDSATIDIPLSFLAAGDWKATRLGDVPDKPDAWDRAEERVNGQSSWRVPLSPRGGFVAWIRK
jgi:alpha-glucosidase